MYVISAGYRHIWIARAGTKQEGLCEVQQAATRAKVQETVRRCSDAAAATATATAAAAAATAS